MRWARAQWRVGRTVPACAPVSAKHCCRPHDRGGGQPSTRRPNTRFSDRGGLSILSIGPKPRACCTRLRCNPSESVGARFVVSSHRRQICDRRRGPPSALGTPHNVSSPSLSPRQAGRSSHSMLRIPPGAVSEPSARHRSVSDFAVIVTVVDMSRSGELRSCEPSPRFHRDGATRATSSISTYRQEAAAPRTEHGSRITDHGSR